MRVHLPLTKRPGPGPYLVLLCLLPAACSEPSSSEATDGDRPVFFEDVTARLGLDFHLDRSQAGDYFMPDSMGTDVALLDYDNDGDLDL